MVEGKISEHSTGTPVSEPEVELNNEGQEAHAMFMRYVPIGAIAKSLGRDERWVKGLIKSNGWRAQRKKTEEEIRNRVKFTALTRLNSITNNGLIMVDVALRKAAQAYKEEERAPSLVEARMILDITEKCHKMKHLEQAATGSTTGPEGMAPSEVMDSFMNDPYMRKAFTQASLLVDGVPVTEILANDSELKDDDLLNQPNSERSASQEARTLTEGT